MLPKLHSWLIPFSSLRPRATCLCFSRNLARQKCWNKLPVAFLFSHSIASGFSLAHVNLAAHDAAWVTHTRVGLYLSTTAFRLLTCYSLRKYYGGASQVQPTVTGQGNPRSSLAVQIAEKFAATGALLMGREVGEDISFFLAAGAAMLLSTVSPAHVLRGLALALLIEHCLSTAGLAHLLHSGVHVPSLHVPFQRAVGLAIFLAACLMALRCGAL